METCSSYPLYLLHRIVRIKGGKTYKIHGPTILTYFYSLSLLYRIVRIKIITQIKFHDPTLLAFLKRCLCPNSSLHRSAIFALNRILVFLKRCVCSYHLSLLHRIFCILRIKRGNTNQISRRNYLSLLEEICLQPVPLLLCRFFNESLRFFRIKDLNEKNPDSLILCVFFCQSNFMEQLFSLLEKMYCSFYPLSLLHNIVAHSPYQRSETNQIVWNKYLELLKKMLLQPCSS